jgi:SET domain-containing protein
LPRRPFEVRNSPIHGRGVFAVRPIERGTTLIEYTGDRISWEEADRRDEGKDPDDTHTMLFTVNSKIVIDASTRGSDARFINHSCWGNCRSYISDDDRVYIEARRRIQPGEELTYDYKLQLEGEKVTRKLRRAYACRCESPKCRGTILYIPGERARVQEAIAKKARAKAAAPKKAPARKRS